MPLTTRFTEAMGVRHPVVCAPMALVTGGRLAAAVSRAGALGFVGGAYAGTLGQRAGPATGTGAGGRGARRRGVHHVGAGEDAAGARRGARVLPAVRLPVVWGSAALRRPDSRRRRGAHQPGAVHAAGGPGHRCWGRRDRGARHRRRRPRGGAVHDALRAGGGRSPGGARAADAAAGGRWHRRWPRTGGGADARRRCRRGGHAVLGGGGSLDASGRHRPRHRQGRRQHGAHQGHRPVARRGCGPTSTPSGS